MDDRTAGAVIAGLAGDMAGPRATHRERHRLQPAPQDGMIADFPACAGGKPRWQVTNRTERGGPRTSHGQPRRCHRPNYGGMPRHRDPQRFSTTGAF